MYIKLLDSPDMAQEMSDVNHAAFGYRSIRDLSRYQINLRIKSKRYESYGLLDGKHVVGFLYIDHRPDQFIVDSKEKCIESFSLLPWLQGKGLGKAILNHVINEVYSESSFHLLVDTNNKAVFLYKKLGFISYGVNTMTRSENYTAMGLIRG